VSPTEAVRAELDATVDAGTDRLIAIEQVPRLSVPLAFRSAGEKMILDQLAS
jgi:hypothetical protein